MTFFLGTHLPNWLAFAGVPLFVSRRRLAGRRTLPLAAGPWAQDSGGFTELQMFGRWTVSARQYAEETERFYREVGRMEWAAPQDWMCEPIVIAGGNAGPVAFAGTGLSVREHQDRTTENLLELRSLAPSLPWAPVLQGWDIDDYHRHADGYAAAGIDLASEPIVGVGSVCRRQDTVEAEAIFRELHGRGLRLHGFGLKLLGLKRCAGYLASSDSLAWSMEARRRGPLPGCESKHKSCANCYRYALGYRDRVLRVIARPVQGSFLGRPHDDDLPRGTNQRPDGLRLHQLAGEGEGVAPEQPDARPDAA